MTFRRLSIPNKPSQRAIRNQLQGLSALALGTTPTYEQTAPRKTGPQKETGVVKSVQALWSAIKRGVLYRNRRGMAQLANGGMLPYGLGPNGTGDAIGHSLVRITPAMVNKLLPIYTEFEGKTDAGRLAPHQSARIDELRAVNAIAGCVRSPEDADAIYREWLSKQEQP